MDHAAISRLDRGVALRGIGHCDQGKAPRSVIVIAVDAVYFQCALAIVRSKLWDQATHADPQALPTPGQILAELSENRVGGAEYDRLWPARARDTMW